MLEAIVEMPPLKSMVGDQVSPLMLKGMIDIMKGKTVTGLVKIELYDYSAHDIYDSGNGNHAPSRPLAHALKAITAHVEGRLLGTSLNGVSRGQEVTTHYISCLTLDSFFLLTLSSICAINS